MIYVAEQTGLILTLSESPEDRVCRVVAHIGYNFVNQ